MVDLTEGQTVTPLSGYVVGGFVSSLDHRLLPDGEFSTRVTITGDRPAPSVLSLLPHAVQRRVARLVARENSGG